MFNPYNPYDLMLLEQPGMKDLTPEEQEEVATKTTLFGSSIYVLAIILGLALCALLGSCTTTNELSYAELHRIVTTANRMDSTLMAHTVARQDSTWHQEILRQFQSIREKSDTSHSVTLNAAGDTIRERIVINNIRETTSSTDRQLLTVLSHRLEVMDSTVQQQSLQISRMDSLLRQQSKTIEAPVAQPLSWLQQVQIWLGRLVLVAIAVLAALWLVRKKAWWLALLRKLV